MSLLAQVLRVLLFSLSLGSCASETNVFGIIHKTISKTKAFDNELALARIYYDGGDLKKALEHAELAFAMNPESEAAALTLGYTYLGMAGVTPLGLMGKLSEAGKKKRETEAKADLLEGGPDTSSTNSEAPPSTKDALGDLGDVLVLTDEDFKKLGFKNVDEPDLPVIEPVCAGEARHTIDKLSYLSKATSVICGFVDKDLLLGDDPRHQCTPAKSRKKKRVMSHVLWAFAHLIEALAFQSVITYSTTNKGKTNLELRVEALENFNVENLADLPLFIKKLESLTSLIDKVIPISGTCAASGSQSQLTGLINDLVSVSYAFGRLSGVPPEITAQINASVAEIASIQSQTSGLEAKQAQSKSIKKDFTQGMSEVLAEKINEFNPEDLSQEEKDNVCAAYASMSGQELSTANEAAPDLCK